RVRGLGRCAGRVRRAAGRGPVYGGVRDGAGEPAALLRGGRSAHAEQARAGLVAQERDRRQVHVGRPRRAAEPVRRGQGHAQLLQGLVSLMRKPSLRALSSLVSLYRAVVTQDEDGGEVVTYG